MHTRFSGMVGENQPARAFTLIELLVVIAIIGILTSILLPVLSRTKTRAISITDVNNLKQIITANQLYVTDSNDILPWPNWLSGDRPNRPGWLYSLDTSVIGPARFKAETGLFWGSLHLPQIYMCPMDVTNTTQFSQRDQQISSYAMNGAVIGYSRTNYPAVKSVQMRPDDVLFWETDEKQPKYFNDGSNFPKEGVSIRHLNGAINATIGGSVSYIRIDYWYLQVDDPNKNSLWCYPGSSDGR
jgi:prepilin-type N-terminal cleavage/methylation domain-containing protein